VFCFKGKKLGEAIVVSGGLPVARPYTIVFSTATIDGRIASRTGYSRLSCSEDFDLQHRLRAWADAVMVGSNTALADNPSLTVRRASGVSPLRVVVDSRLRVPPESRVFDGRAPSVLVTTVDWGERDLEAYARRGVRVVRAGSGRVDLVGAMNLLHGLGVRRLMVEGGGALNYALLVRGLVDEVWVTYAPEVFGSGVSVFDGEGVDGVEEKIELHLKKSEVLCGGWIHARYSVIRPKLPLY
jgi:2,5-diamino-6-(ribosylamino)-4(3H)-pyrimidinone 5'-phosphate reductase